MHDDILEQLLDMDADAEIGADYEMEYPWEDDRIVGIGIDPWCCGD